MTNGQTSSAVPAPQPPAWQSALIVLAVLFALSETVYLVLGGIAKMCLAEGATCGTLAMGISNALFAGGTNESGVPVFSNIFSIGLPGFNNLFYLFIAGFGIDSADQMLSTVAASVIVGFLVVWGYVAMSAKRSTGLRLLLAIAFAIGWWLFYNGVEASVYKAEFVSLISARYLEIPIGTISLFVASFFVSRRA